MKKSYESSGIIPIPGASIAILQARWHSEHTDRIVHVCKEMLELAQCARIDLHQVPGSYELAFAAKKLAKLKRYDAIMVVGAIVKGETDHYQIILDTCIRELGKVMYDFEVPIIMEILPVSEIRHLEERSRGKNNKGIEAALAISEIITWTRSLALTQAIAPKIK